MLYILLAVVNINMVVYSQNHRKQLQTVHPYMTLLQLLLLIMIVYKHVYDSIMFMGSLCFAHLVLFDFFSYIISLTRNRDCSLKPYTLHTLVSQYFSVTATTTITPSHPSTSPCRCDGTLLHRPSLHQPTMTGQ